MTTLNRLNIFGDSRRLKEQKQETVDITDKYRSLVENLSVGVYRNTPGPQGHFLEVNSAFVAMFEAKSKEELLSHKVSDFYQNPKNREQFVEEIMKSGEVRNKEIDLITLKGKKFTGSVTAVMKKDKNGEVYFDGVIQDVTEYKKMEEELIGYRDGLADKVRKRTEELQELNVKLNSEIAERKKIEKTVNLKNKNLEDTKQAMLNLMEDLEAAKKLIGLEKAKDEAILASIGEGMVAVDNEGIVMVINQVGCRLLGFKKHELLGKKFIDIVGMVDEKGIPVPKKKRPIQVVISSMPFPATMSTATTKPVYSYVRRDGTSFPISITVTPIVTEKAIGVIEIFRDVTRELEIDRSKSEFVSLASHQLRTPLGIMKWYLEALIDEEYYESAPVEIRKYLDEVYKSNERVLSLVRDLLSVSRIDQGRVRNALKSVDLMEQIGEVVEQMQILASKRNITLNLDIPDREKVIVTIDFLRFHEVIENLITNAIEYTRDRGIVHIAAKKQNGEIVISVADNGIGISESDQKKLFTKFFRTENAIKHNPEGSGLGLYVVRSYIDGWGGKVTVKSEEGKGSTFTIRLPISIKKLKEGGDNNEKNTNR